jgi:hypothetical protein
MSCSTKGEPVEILTRRGSLLTGGGHKAGSEGFLDLSGAEAARTNTDLFHRSLLERADPL